MRPILLASFFGLALTFELHMFTRAFISGELMHRHTTITVRGGMVFGVCMTSLRCACMHAVC